MRKLLTLLVLGLLVSISSYGQQPSRYTPIDSVQFVSMSKLKAGIDSPLYYKIGDSVTIQGVVTFKPTLYGLSANRKAAWLQADTGNFKGILVMMDYARLKTLRSNTSSAITSLADLEKVLKFYQNMVPGKTVRVTGIVDDFGGETQLVLLPIETEITKLTTTTIPPRVTIIDSFSQVDASNNQVKQVASGEKYEGSIIELKDVAVTSNSYNATSKRYTWSVKDSKGNIMNIRDVSQYFRGDQNAADTLKGYTLNIPTVGTALKYIRGMVVQNGTGAANAYWLAPRDTNDIGVANFSYPVISKVFRKPTLATSSDKVDVYATITNAGGDVISSAVIKYEVGGGSFSTVSMTEVDATNFIWKGTIPAQADKSVVGFKIIATNNKSRQDSLKSEFKYLVSNTPLKKIADIHYRITGASSSIHRFDTLTGLSIKGVVMSKFLEGSFFKATVQDGTNPYSAVMLDDDVAAGVVKNLKIGDSITITGGYVAERTKITYLDNPTYTNNGKANMMFKAVEDTAVTNKLLDSNYTMLDKYQSMLVKFNNLVVSSKNADFPSAFGEFKINFTTKIQKGLRVDDLADDISANYGDTLTVGQKVKSIAGIVYGANSNYKLEPRSKTDILLATGLETVTYSNNNLTMYPNPSTGLLNMNLENAGTLSIYDMNGRLVYQTATKGGLNQFNLNLTNGLYNVQFTDKISVKNQKLIILQ